MLTLFIRTLLIYLFTFIVIRLMGKRELSDMQPFDLVITLFIAQLASIPMSDPSTPLFYGLVPILGLFVLHRLVSFCALKNEKVRKWFCGSPLLIISEGIIQEDVMRSANYTLSDLEAQLRQKDVFSFSQVEYAILETDGGLSVLLKDAFQQPTNERLTLKNEKAAPALMLVSDGKIHFDAVKKAGLDEKSFIRILKNMGIKSEKECLFVLLNSDGMLHAQDKQHPLKKTKVHFGNLKINGVKS